MKSSNEPTGRSPFLSWRTVGSLQVKLTDTREICALRYITGVCELPVDSVLKEMKIHQDMGGTSFFDMEFIKYNFERLEINQKSVISEHVC